MPSHHKPIGNVLATRSIAAFQMAARSLDPALLAHELGHMYGANHANLDTPTGPEEYGDRFCVMGREDNKFTFVHPKLGVATGPGMVAPG